MSKRHHFPADALALERVADQERHFGFFAAGRLHQPDRPR